MLNHAFLFEKVRFSVFYAIVLHFSTFSLYGFVQVSGVWRGFFF